MDLQVSRDLQGFWHVLGREEDSHLMVVEEENGEGVEVDLVHSLCAEE
jgi:hypothetical protein